MVLVAISKEKYFVALMEEVTYENSVFFLLISNTILYRLAILLCCSIKTTFWLSSVLRILF
jgi:hypothetical protein